MIVPVGNVQAFRYTLDDTTSGGLELSSLAEYGTPASKVLLRYVRPVAWGLAFAPDEASQTRFVDLHRSRTFFFGNVLEQERVLENTHRQLNAEHDSTFACYALMLCSRALP